MNKQAETFRERSRWKPEEICRIEFEMLRVLVVEDEPIAAIDLEDAITDICQAVVVTKSSVESTKRVLHEAFDFAFLDVNVTNGQTFEVAHILEMKCVPFVFVSGSLPEELPDELRSVPFLSKPVRRSQIVEVLLRAHAHGERPAVHFADQNRE